MATIVQTPVRSDSMIRESVISELRWNPKVATSADVAVAVKEGVVTLSGFVHSYFEKDAAEKAATQKRNSLDSPARRRSRLPCSPNRTFVPVLHSRRRFSAWFRQSEGLAHDLAKEDDAAARAYIRAANSRSELGRPSIKKGVVPAAENVIPSAQAKAVLAFLKKKGQKALGHLGDIEKALGDGSETNTVEQALADLGASLGLESSRPDHASKSGPDVSWRHVEDRTGVALEAKTNKKPTSKYTKTRSARRTTVRSGSRHRA